MPHPSINLRRSALYMPASVSKLLDKAPSLAADVIITDLEDAVAAADKPRARDNLRAINGFAGREWVVRLNAAQTPAFDADLALLSDIRPDAVLLPMIDAPQDVQHALARIQGTGYRGALWLMIETPLAVLNIASIAALALSMPALQCLVIGTNDLAKATGARQLPGRAPMLAWLAQCVLAARAYGLDCLDSVYTDLRDADGLRAECQQGADCGMNGKTLIHPAQIAVCNAVFSPSESELAFAQAVVSAFADGALGARQVQGQMVEALHLAMAEKTLQRQRLIEGASLV